MKQPIKPNNIKEIFNMYIEKNQEKELNLVLRKRCLDLANNETVKKHNQTLSNDLKQAHKKLMSCSTVSLQQFSLMNEAIEVVLDETIDKVFLM